jgi:hypothetical protein
MTAIADLTDLTALDRAECLGLLAAGSIGRVVCTDGALPTAEPVSFILDHEEIIFRTRVGSRLATAARNAVVAFQADAFDVTTGAGWSVLGVGKAYEVLGGLRLAELAAGKRLSAAPQHGAHLIAIPLWRLTGRRLTMRGPAPNDLLTP